MFVSSFQLLWDQEECGCCDVQRLSVSSLKQTCGFVEKEPTGG